MVKQASLFFALRAFFTAYAVETPPTADFQRRDFDETSD
jgi:hypothetical protein